MPKETTVPGDLKKPLRQGHQEIIKRLLTTTATRTRFLEEPLEDQQEENEKGPQIPVDQQEDEATTMKVRLPTKARFVQKIKKP